LRAGGHDRPAFGRTGAGRGRPCQSVPEPGRGHDQPAVPEQHLLRHRAGRRGGERPQHPAGDPDQSRALEPDQPDDHAADLPTRSHGGLPELPEGVSGGSTFGLGDINYTGWLSPAAGGPITWGIGPSISIPTATDEKLGTEKWSAGPSAVVVAQPGPFVLGGLVRQLWSFAGDGDRQDVSQMLIQPFLNYNLEEGWFLVSAPIITANWEADSDDRWTVPVGGGAGRVFRIGTQALNATLQAYYNVEAPEFGPDWSLRFAISFLFPK
jgi:hypothetical protein